MINIVINNSKKILSKNIKYNLIHKSYYYNILISLGFSFVYPPLANLISIYCNISIKEQWLVVSLVHWKLYYNQVMIVASDSSLQLNELESRLWFYEISQFFKSDDINLIYYNPYIWLINIKNKPLIYNPSIYVLLNKPIYPSLFYLDKTLFWQKKITELQMYLYSHSLNKWRPPGLTINSLWIWGHGKFIFPKLIKIITNDLILLKYFSEFNNIMNFSYKSKFDKNCCVFIKYPKEEIFIFLKKKLKKYSTYWHWNNVSLYYQAKRFWFF
ncbi:hypothetical protein CCU22_00375 [Candidatus Legionella polyplacis]|uniref:Uncharacterized protein n=1 Tax=Candidatus Legionella polyplacis TaxID=2005262 RepID=A0ABZ2GZG1_9GAMM|nr:hypothetical protein [Candidatus Legionella polyplacis]ATW01692.1 hypothetical protein CCU22_00375 [Candidatus Legionella polyplacis]